jgi:hypothetical protein
VQVFLQFRFGVSQGLGRTRAAERPWERGWLRTGNWYRFLKKGQPRSQGFSLSWERGWEKVKRYQFPARNTKWLKNGKLRRAILSAFYNISQRNFGILLILWCSFKLWWNFCLDLSRSKFCSLGNRPLVYTVVVFPPFVLDSVTYMFAVILSCLCARFMLAKFNK